MCIVVSVQMGCIDEIKLPSIALTDRDLVIDGWLNTSGKDSTKFVLSWSEPLAGSETPEYESGAKLVLEIENEDRLYEFEELELGQYYLPPITIGEGVLCKIKITLKNGDVVESDNVPNLKSPKIDSVSFKVEKRKGVQVYITSKDGSKNYPFYRWILEETWINTAAFEAHWEIQQVNGVYQIVDIVADKYFCWNTQLIKSIKLASSATIQSGVVIEKPLIFISADTDQLLKKYSLLTKQLVLTQEAYQYWKQIEDYTELSGGVFDPMPSKIKGNWVFINDSNRGTHGYFSACAPDENRIFIDEGMGLGSSCELFAKEKDIFTLAEVVDLPLFREGALQVAFYDGEFKLIKLADKSCLDCRLKGGTNKMPDFWIP